MGRREFTQLVKQSAQGRWIDVLETVAGIPREKLDGRNHPCPACGGDDRFALMDEERGAVICRKCFSEKNGDGISAVKHFRGVTFNEAVDRIAEFLGVELPKKKRKKKSPEDYLKFAASGEIPEQVAYAFCKNKPGVKPIALKRAGARSATYRKEFNVLAFPVFGKNQDLSSPCGWIVSRIDGENLPKYNPQGEVVGKTRWKVLYGSEPGLLGQESIACLNTPGLVDRVYKVEGISDMLALMSIIPQDYSTRQVVVTNSNGTDEKPGWRADFLAGPGREVIVIHDCDEPGQAGAKEWSQRIAIENAKGVTKNVVLPYMIEKKSGQDLRDFLADNSYDELNRIVAEASPLERPVTETGEIDLTKVQYPVQQLILDKLNIEVLYEEESGRIRIFSHTLRKSSWIRDVNRVTRASCIQFAGPAALTVVSSDPEPPESFNVASVRDAIATSASMRRGRDNERGVGVWQGLDEWKQETDTIVLVGDSEGARFNGDKVLRRVEVPRVDGLVLDFGSGNEEWYDFDQLKSYLEQAQDTDWRKRVLKELHDILSLWQWEQKNAPLTVAGLVLCSWLQTIWTWRPLVSISGATNSGKSMLFEALGGRPGNPGVFGALAFKQAKSTEAGLRQGLGNTGKIPLCDEFEAGKERTAILEKLFRPSTRGDSVARGTTDQRGMTTNLRHIGWIAATETGLTKTPDANRFISLDLIRPANEDYGKLVLPPGVELANLGQKLLAIAVGTAIRAKQIAGEIKSTKSSGIDPRTIESYAVPAACMAAGYGYETPQAIELLNTMLSDVDRDTQGQSDEEQLVADILDSQIFFGPKVGSVSVARAIEPGARGLDVAEGLEAHGVRGIDGEGLYVVPRVVSRTLLRGTEWEGQKIDQLLMRIRGVERRRLRCNGTNKRGLVIPTWALNTEEPGDSNSPDNQSDLDSL